MISMMDNRKFFKINDLVYEVPPKINVYHPDETLEEKINYRYNLPADSGKDVYSYRYDDNYYGSRDADSGVFSKADVSKIPQRLNSTIEFDKSRVEPIKENFVYENKEDHVCMPDTDGEKNICGGGANLFPIMDPRFNLREAAKNMILLEDHLTHEGKRCHDCVLKHCLTIEGFLEEGITLDVKRDYIDILEKSEKEFRAIFIKLAKMIRDKTLTSDMCREMSQLIRKIRKPLCQQYATFLG